MDAGTLIRAVMEIDPAANAVEQDGRWLQWGEMRAQVDALDDVLNAQGLGAGARVGIMLRNRVPQFNAIIGTLVSDRCMVTINPLYPDAVVVEDVRGLALPAVIAQAEDLDRPGIMEMLAQSGAAVIELPSDWTAAPRVRLARRETPDQRVETPGVTIEMLTSGTTGKPKRVALTRKAFQYSFAGALHYEKRDGSPGGAIEPQLRNGVQIIAGPLAHIGGTWVSLMAVASGRKIVLLEKFTVAGWMDVIRRHRPKVTGVTGTGLKMVLDANVPAEDLSSLIAIPAGAAPVAPETVDGFLERYNIPILSNYGATEFAGAIAGWSLAEFRRHWKEKRGSCGKVHDNVEARVVDPETGAILPPMTEGVLELKSPQLADPENWLRTTDLAKLDEDRYLWITGRADNAIIRGGFKVQPDDVRRALELHPAIREAVVVGIKDDRLGQVPVAALIPMTGADVPDEGELKSWLRETLLPYQIPVAFKVVDDVPRTISLKPKLKDVAALFEGQAV